MDAIRAQLDELLGKDRNMLPKDRAKRQPHFSDPEICKYFLCGLCPNELFTNTSIRDLGPCTKLHDEDCLKQVKKNKERLILDAAKLAAEEGLQDNSAANIIIKELDDRIQAMLKKAEELGEEGQITEAQELMEQAEKLKEEKSEIEKAEEAKAHDKKMSVCDICGALLFVGDKEKRSMSHLEGKKHDISLKLVYY
eukprot:gene12914-15169_t